MKIEYNELEDFVYNYPTKHKQGFTGKEVLQFIEELKLDKDTFFDKLGVNTCMLVDGDVITYHRDILKGLLCVLENRDMYWYEFD
jgi:hypothetical protein